MTVARLPAVATPYRSSNRITPSGVQPTWPGRPRTRRPIERSVSPSTSFSGGMRASTGSGSSPAGSGSWHRMPCTSWSATSAATASSTCAWLASLGRPTCFDTIPASPASLRLLATYSWLGLSSPTSTVARHTAGDPAASMVARSEAMISPRNRMPSMRMAPPGVRSKFGSAEAMFKSIRNRLNRRKRPLSVGERPPGSRRHGGSSRSAAEASPDHQDSPTISPCSSKSMMLAAGAEPRPGMVVMSPQIG